MSVEFKHQDFTTGKGILVFPDHYVCVAHTFKKDDSAAQTVDGRKIVKAGTIYPANDNTAIGVVWADYDVTDGDITGSLLIHGFVKKAAIPVIPSANAASALNLIKFLPLAAAQTSMTAQALTVAVGEAAETTHQIRVDIQGIHFREEAATVSNWTVTGANTTKVSVDNIAVGPEGTYVIITTKNTAATVAGNLTVAPKAAATTTGDVPAAVTIVTVSGS